MNKLKALWQRLYAWAVQPDPFEQEEITSEWIVVGPNRKILL